MDNRCDDVERNNWRISRRRLLQSTLGAGVGLGVAGTLDLRAEGISDLRARAKKNFKLGIMSSVYGDLPVDEAARQIKADGFSCVVCDFAFADVRFNSLEPDWAAAQGRHDARNAPGSRSSACLATTTSWIPKCREESWVKPGSRPC